MEEKTDVVIIGAGLVGSSMALALSKLPIKITVLETHLPDLDPKADVHSRPLSLTYASQKILQALGVWPELSKTAVAIKKVHVSEEKRLGELCFSAEEAHVSALGYVVAHSQLQRVLYQRAAQQTNVKFINIASLDKIETHEQYAELSYSASQEQHQLKTELLIAADGSRSRCRELLKIDVDEQDFSETALTSTVQLASPHLGVAYERFTAIGTLALLPQHDPMQSRLVWVAGNDQAKRMQTWSESQLTRQVSEHFGGRLMIESVKPFSKGYPLKTLWPKKQIMPHALLLGNAAHTLYPLAAQGFNLGLKDVAVLAEKCNKALAQKKSLGNSEVLQSYIKARQKDQALTRGITSGISQGFSLNLPGLGVARGLSLLALSVCQPLKKQLMRQLMGLGGSMPELVKMEVEEI